MGTVASEIQQARPFDRPERELMATVLRTADVARHALESAFRPWGISQEQYNVLRILRGAAPDGLPCLEVAERMLSRSPNITRLLDKLVAKALVERNALPTDRRVVRVNATERGLALLAELDGAMTTLLDRLSSIDGKDLRNVVSHLDRVRDVLACPTAREDAARRRGRG